MENLPIYAEVFNGEKYILKFLHDNEGVLMTDYQPFKKIDYTIPKGTEVVMIDSKINTLVYFRTKLNYFDALHFEINELLDNILSFSEINSDRVKRIEYGLKFLSGIIKKIKNPSDISDAMIHPTEMVIDILMKFKVLQNPPVELLAACFDVCAELIPFFDEEIFRRIINLNILPTVNNVNLDYKAYSNGVSFESGLVGHYLVNLERNQGRYSFLKSYLNFLKAYTKVKLSLVA